MLCPILIKWVTACLVFEAVQSLFLERSKNADMCVRTPHWPLHSAGLCGPAPSAAQHDCVEVTRFLPTTPNCVLHRTCSSVRSCAWQEGVPSRTIVRLPHVLSILPRGFCSCVPFSPYHCPWHGGILGFVSTVPTGSWFVTTATHSLYHALSPSLESVPSLFLCCNRKMRPPPSVQLDFDFSLLL